MIDIIIPVSAGELMDKLTILEIKKNRIADSHKLRFINDEYDRLNEIAIRLDLYTIVDAKVLDNLRLVNLALWNIINEMMIMETTETFNYVYYDLAKKIRSLNDDRYECKSAIDNIIDSDVKEQKGYTDVEIND